MTTTSLTHAAKSLVALAALVLGCNAHAQESLPQQVAGTWKIVRMLPTKNTGCWDGAKSLVGTALTYRQHEMRWQGGSIPLTGIVTRTVTTDTFTEETSHTLGTPLRLTELNITSPRVLEVDMQHDDADVTGSTTEIPGDSVLLVGRNTIVVSACGTFFEATRSTASARVVRASQSQPAGQSQGQ
jgi:hypothetical protein